LRKPIIIVACGLCLFSGCGGGSTGSSISLMGAPAASISPTSLTFGTEVVGTTSQSLPITVTNSGTAALNISSVVATANFGQSNNCGTSLAAGAKCIISVTLTPSASGTLSGTVSITDNASGSPQTVALKGTGTTGATQDILTGDCWGGVSPGAPQQCGIGQDTSQCPTGQVAITPTTVSACLPPQSMLIDTSTMCQFKTANGESVSGSCVVQVSGSGSCSVQGQECGAPQLPPCCSGFTCVPASTRAFCEPQ
jgi:Abnormal spindle-like microcephaly-assoc'd, ASPM-SPD-2-Hydin